MQAVIKIKRRANADSPAYLQSFAYEGNAADSIAFILNELNNREQLTDVSGQAAAPIAWECGCRQKKCGACAMLINRVPKLACSAFLETVLQKRNVVTLEPLCKFPIVADLIVDRSSMHESLKDMKLWLEDEAYLSGWNHEAQYQSSRCILCGCCLEVCPNFSFGQEFSGAIATVNAYRVLDQSQYDEHRSEVGTLYRKHYFEGCEKSLSCHNICPIGLPVEDLMVRSNAAAVWKK